MSTSEKLKALVTASGLTDDEDTWPAHWAYYMSIDKPQSDLLFLAPRLASLCADMYETLGGYRWDYDERDDDGHPNEDVWAVMSRLDALVGESDFWRPTGECPEC